MKEAKILIVFAALLSILLTDGAVADDKVVLAELFTGTTCGYCPDANEALDDIIDNYPDMIAVVRYHVSSGDPFYTYNTTENYYRAMYYGVTGIPACQIDGYITPSDYTAYWSVIQNRSYMDPPVEIDLSGSYNEASATGTLDIEIAAIDIANYDELYVRVALTESDIYYYAPNGIRYHDQTMRDMIPDQQGTAIEIEYGETVELSVPFAIDTELEFDNLEFVVWVQTDYSQAPEVYQAAIIKPSDLAATDIEDDLAKLPESFSLNQNYPNPFNATTTISYSLENQSSVDLAVYDLAGRKVAQLVNGVMPAGEHSIVWNGLDNNGGEVATGIYFYRLETDSERFTKRMTLLK